jgi:hypothetical protein
LEGGLSNQDAYTFNYRDVILADHPIMYWRLGETAGPFAYDESVNRRDATYIGRPSLGLPGAIADDSNSSVEFNGINGYVEWDPNLSISGVSYFGGVLICSNAFTVEVWVKEKKVPRADTFLTTVWVGP